MTVSTLLVQEHDGQRIYRLYAVKHIGGMDIIKARSIQMIDLDRFEGVTEITNLDLDADVIFSTKSRLTEKMLIKEIENLHEILDFYANADNHTVIDPSVGLTAIQKDSGLRARVKTSFSRKFIEQGEKS